MTKWLISIKEWWEERKYPKEVKKLLRRERFIIRLHEKKLKNMRKYNSGTPRAIKTNRYLINKAKKNIEGIKEHYGKSGI
jgi:hypothetical protein